jgi:hypothetical protein
MGEVFTSRVYVKRGDNYKLLGTISKHLGEDTQFCAEVINKYSLRRQNKLLGRDKCTLHSVVTIYNNDYSTATEYKQVAVIKNNSDDEDDFQLTNHLLVLAEDSSHRGGTLIPLTDKSAIAFEEDEDTEYAFEPVGEFEESTENLDNTANQ